MLLYQYFMKIFSKRHALLFQENVPFKPMFLHGCHSAFLYYLHSSLLFTQSVDYGLLKDVFNGEELDRVFPRSRKGILKSKDS